MITLKEVSDSIKSKGKFWIAFSGDSITSCEWVHPNYREIVEYVLQEEMTNYLGDWKSAEWGVKGFNFGYDGSTTKDILDKSDEILSLRPSLVILMIGGNDPSAGISPVEHKENIIKIKNKFEENDIKFVFSTDNKPWNDKAVEKYRPYIEIDKKIEMGESQFVNLFEISENFPNERIYTFKSEENSVEGIKEGDLDFWHPNQLGNAYIAKVILKEVFDIKFDPEKYIKETLSGEKYPGYK